MPDYQLERLNTRSFEQLVQALGLAIIGPQLMIFGDGPDGGREATFNGAVNYPSSKESWNGYGIVQAKFRQKPDSEQKKNADWAIKQLNSEFANFSTRPKDRKATSSNNRICPEYYIFATNLVLSPGSETGGKDRVRALFDGYKKSHGLKDYAIWDSDQIRGFLEKQIEIRTTYYAWLMPGDVLSEIMKHLKLENTDFPLTILRYLKSELLDDQFARLSQGGYTDAKNILLSSVFVDLPIDRSQSFFAQGEGLILQILQRTGEIANFMKPSGNKTENDIPPTFLNIFLEESRQVLKPSMICSGELRKTRDKRQDGRMVLIGGPGQGKTTVGIFACQLFRAALLRATGANFSPEVSQALNKIEEMANGLPAVCARRYPLRVDLKNLATSLAEEKTTNLFDYLLKRIETRTNSKIGQGHFRLWLGSYPWLLVLDGLDEVPASSNREQVMRAIGDFVNSDAHGADADLLILATTRPQGYSEEFDPMFYKHLQLAPLTPDQALSYGLGLAKARHPDGSTRIDDLSASLEKATKNPATVRLMQSPLQVTIMLALIEGGGEPPVQRWKLFRDYYEVIYRREKERGTEFSPYLSDFEPDLHKIHHRVGWILQQRNSNSGSTGSRLTHTEFEQIVDDRLKSSGHDDKKRLELVKTIRQIATDRLVLLVGNTEKEIGFEIRSLQEFMAAEHFFDGGETCVRDSLRAIAPFPYWRNIFLFAAGRIFFERQELIETTIILECHRLNDDPADPAQMTIFAGSRLALELLKDGAARNRPCDVRVLARCAARALDAFDGEESNVFSELFTGEAEELWKEELSKRLTTSGPNFPYQNWILCLRLVGQGKPWAQELMMNYFPWIEEKAEKFIKFFSSYDEKRLPEAFYAEFSRNLFNHSPIFLSELHGKNPFSNILHGEEQKQFTQVLEPREHLECRVLLKDKSFSGLEFEILGSENLSDWARLQYPNQMKNSHFLWQVFQTITAFSQKPTKLNLANQLKVISQIDLEGASGQMNWIFPWQIAICLRARNAGRSWQEIISSVEAGSIGSEGDWVRWQGENNDGLVLSKFRFTDEMSVSDEFQGLIFSNSDGLTSPQNITFHLIEQLSESIEKWPEIRKSDKLMDLACRAFSTLDMDFKIHSQLFTRFIRTFSNNNLPITNDVLDSILCGSFTVGEKLDLLTKTGSCRIKERKFDRVSDSVVNESLEAIVRELPACNEWWNVLRSLSFLPPSESLQQIPETFLVQLPKKGETYAKASTALKLSTLRWKTEESADIVRKAFVIKEDYPKHLRNLLEFIDTRRKSEPHLEAFLMELIKQPTFYDNPDLIKQASGLLVKLVERRPTSCQLPDPTAIRPSS
ncbi:MAG: hypothetical protein HQM08_19790 [Candidatus Riflebacteria bacterium]|nr:hypothetical protein [Candidatus Riflebacteria bacterium]